MREHATRPADSSPAAAVPEAEARHGFLGDVLAGLSGRPKTLPCKYLYDERGAELFDCICRLDSYYLTRAELEILRLRAHALGALFAKGACLIELGSGSGVKSRALLDAAPAIRTYLPIDLAAPQLEENARDLARRYPQLEVIPIVADYEQPLLLPRRFAAGTVVYFPGSTIGNLEPPAAVSFLIRLAQLAGSGGVLLVAADRKKSPSVLHRAYNDPEGVTAAFNLNLLERINRELGASIDTAGFAHHATYAPQLGCVEMYLVALEAQRFEVGGRTFELSEGEAIRTERSYKYTVAELESLVEEAGLHLRGVHSDERELLSLYEIAAP